MAFKLSASGPVGRGSSLCVDIRTAAPIYYGIYSTINFTSYLGTHGDSFDRFLIRLRELFESTRIIFLVLSEFNDIKDMLTITSYNTEPKLKIESLVKLFKLVNSYYILDTAILYGTVESGKGSFTISIVANNTDKPYRVYIRSPAYAHLQLLSIIGSGHCLADLATLLGSLDIVFGEVDR
jgi:NADH-quinone oxidoreductase subunit D